MAAGSLAAPLKIVLAASDFGWKNAISTDDEDA
jgi:hypothetical protein